MISAYENLARNGDGCADHLGRGKWGGCTGHADGSAMPVSSFVQDGNGGRAGDHDLLPRQ